MEDNMKPPTGVPESLNYLHGYRPIINDGAIYSYSEKFTEPSEGREPKNYLFNPAGAKPVESWSGEVTLVRYNGKFPKPNLIQIIKSWFKPRYKFRWKMFDFETTRTEYKVTYTIPRNTRTQIRNGKAIVMEFGKYPVVTEFSCNLSAKGFSKFELWATKELPKPIVGSPDPPKNYGEGPLFA